MKNSALLIIDMQNAYFNNGELEQRKNDLVQCCNQLVESARHAGVPIFSIITEHQKDRSTWTLNMLDDEVGYLFQNEPDTKIVDQLDVQGALSISKTRDSSFFETTLHEQLQGRGIDTVVLAGVSTHSCIYLTAADAYAHNYRVILASEAIATHDNTFHEQALAILEQEYRQKLLSNLKIGHLWEAKPGVIPSQEYFSN